MYKKIACNFLAVLTCSVVLSGCQSSHLTRKDNYGSRPSSYAEILPDDNSVSRQYIPSGLRDSPNSPVAYHTPPSVSYDDATLDENLANSLEFVDYYKAVQHAGLQSVLQSEGPFTIMAIPNDVMESYDKSWKGGLFSSINHKALIYFIKQTILYGDWSLPKLKQAVKLSGGIVTVKNLAGEKVTLQPLQVGDILVVGTQGDAHLQPGYYPQSNGALYVSETVPFNH